MNPTRSLYTLLCLGIACGVSAQSLSHEQKLRQSGFGDPGLAPYPRSHGSTGDQAASYPDYETESEAGTAADAGTGKMSTASFPLSMGVIKVESGWTVDPGDGNDVLRGRVSFTPNSAAPACRSIRMVQAARVETKPGQDLDWQDGEANRNLMRTKAGSAHGVTPGFFIDHDAFKCKPGAACSPYFRDSWANPDESADGVNSSNSRSEASLVDYPFGWEFFERIALETCARCADNGEFLGCASWGGSWPAIGDRSLLPAGATNQPSATFSEALRLFDAFY